MPDTSSRSLRYDRRSFRPIDHPTVRRSCLLCFATFLATTTLSLGSAAAEPSSATEPLHEHEHAHEHTHELHEEFERILVTASPLEHAGDELALPVTYLDRDQVLDQLGSTIGETLSSQPGITTSGFAPGASRPVVRGQDSFRVRVLEDGLTAGGVSDLSPDHGVPTNPLLAERIEVLRGPGTLRYGGGAIGGVVNALGDRIPTYLGDRALFGSWFASYDTARESRDVAFRAGGSERSLAWHLDGLYRDADDYDVSTDLGRQPNSSADNQALAGAASYFFEDGRVGFSVGRTEAVYGIPTAEPSSDPVSIDMERNRYEIDAEWSGGPSWVRETRLRGVYSDYDHDEVLRLSGPAASFDNQEIESRVELLHEPAVGGLVGAFGLHWRWQDLTAGGEASELLAPSETQTVATYLFEELPLSEGIELQFGARVEAASVRGRPSGGTTRDRSFVPLSGSLSLQVHRAAWLAGGLSVSLSQRAPSALELFAGGPHEASATFERGDADLDEETSLAVDLSARGQVGERLSYDAGVFYTRYEDFIFGRLTGRSCDEEGDCVVGDGEELDELVYTNDGADYFGGEFSAALDVVDVGDGVVGLDSQLDWVRAKLDSGGNVPRIPPFRWGAGLFYQSPLLRGRVGFLRHEAQNDTAAAESSTAGYTSLEAGGAWMVFLGDASVPVELSVKAENLLDDDGRNHVSFLKDDVVLPGRSLRLALRVDL